MTQETGLSAASTLFAAPGDEGEARWWFGSLAVIKTTAADTEGRMTLVQITEEAP